MEIYFIYELWETFELINSSRKCATALKTTEKPYHLAISENVYVVCI